MCVIQTEIVEGRGLEQSFGGCGFCGSVNSDYFHNSPHYLTKGDCIEHSNKRRSYWKDTSQHSFAQERSGNRCILGKSVYIVSYIDDWSLTRIEINSQGAHLKNEPDQVVKVWAALLELIERGQIRPVLHPKIYDGLEKLPEGLTDLATRKVLAKAILRISSSSEARSKL